MSKDNFLAEGFRLESEESGWKMALRDVYERVQAEAKRYRKNGYLTEVKADGRFLDNVRAYKLMVKRKPKKVAGRRVNRDEGLW